MIRCCTRYPKYQCGISLLEMGYVLLIVGFILGVMWVKAADIYRNFDVTKAGRELNVIVLATRLVHPNDKITASENLDVLNLPADMVGHFQGQTIVFNPWKGRVSLFPGNAGALGADAQNDEFTVRFDGVPSESCADMVMQNTSPQMRALGLVSVMIAPAVGQGKEICFVSDSICRNTVATLLESQIEAFCHEKSRMTVMYTFYAH